MSIDIEQIECPISLEKLDEILINLPCGKHICFSAYVSLIDNMKRHRIVCPFSREKIFSNQCNTTLLVNEFIMKEQIKKHPNMKKDIEKKFSYQLSFFKENSRRMF